MSAFLDLPAASFERTVTFWADVTGYERSEPRGEHLEFATLVPPRADDHLRVQRLEDGDPRIHLDLHVTDAGAAAQRAVSLGAEVLVEHELGYVVLHSPGGLTFCFVSHPASRRPRAVEWADGGRSIVDQVCIDIPSGAYDVEAAFWAELTGWTRETARRTEFEILWQPEDQPIRLLLQRLDEQDGPVRAHLDLACDGREAEVRRHVRLGAHKVADYPDWTVLEDPSGAPYCITVRSPATGSLA